MVGAEAGPPLVSPAGGAAGAAVAACAPRPARCAYVGLDNAPGESRSKLIAQVDSAFEMNFYRYRRVSPRSGPVLNFL